jgi:predicted transcriptional regulator
LSKSRARLQYIFMQGVDLTTMYLMHLNTLGKEFLVEKRMEWYTITEKGKKLVKLLREIIAFMD